VPLGFGVLWSDHAVPFQLPASVSCVPSDSRYAPTAMQLVLDLQETASSRADLAPTGVAGVLSVQVVPDRTTEKAVVVPAPASHEPTATQEVDEVHESPSRLFDLSLGLGSSCCLHVVPSHSTTIIAVVLIAAQTVTELHVTDASPPEAAGGVWSDHALPFQRTMYRCAVPPVFLSA
jgi:hypothetical protein